MPSINAVYMVNENLLPLSNKFSDSSWTKYFITINTTPITSSNLAPTSDALYSKMTETADTGTHGIQKAAGINFVAGTTYTLSCFAKAGDLTGDRYIISLSFLRSSLWGGLGNPTIICDLSTGAITSTSNILSSTITFINNGWYRISVTQTITTSGSSGANLFLVNSGTNTNYAGIAGAGLFIGDVQVSDTNVPLRFLPTFSQYYIKSITPSTPRYLVIPEMFGAIGDYEYLFSSATNDTTAINNAIIYLNALGGGELRFDDSKSYYCDAILPLSNVHINFGKSTIVKTDNSGSRYLDSLLLIDITTQIDSTYYNQFNNIQITGGYFCVPSSVTTGTTLIKMRFCTDLVIKGLSINGYIPGTWCMELGGRRLTIEDVTITGGVNLFEDGIHISHGQYINISNCHIESGDDSIAIGSYYISGDLFAIEPDPIRYVNAVNCTVHSNMAVGIKVYVPSDSEVSGTDWEVTDINISNISGMSGINRNGGITVFDNATITRNLIKRINISNVAINVGSINWGNDGNNVNPFALYILNVKDISLDNIKFIITENPTTTTDPMSGTLLYPFNAIYIVQGINISINNLQINEVAPTNNGVEIYNSSNIRISRYLYNRATNANSNPANAFYLSGVLGFEIIDSIILGIQGANDLFHIDTVSYSTTTITSLNNIWSQISPSTGQILNFSSGSLTGLSLINDDYSLTTGILNTTLVSAITNVRITDNIGIVNIGLTDARYQLAVNTNSEIIRVVNSATTIAVSDITTAWLGNTITTAFTITLPAPSAMYNSSGSIGRKLLFKNTGANTLTIAGTNIDGTTAYSLITYASVTLLSDGINWNVIN